MNIGTICKRHLVTVDGSDTLQRAATLMREHHVGALVVTSRGDAGTQVVGMLTDRDLAIEGLARGGDASRLTVGSLAYRPQGPLVSVREDESIADAVVRMQAAGVRRLLVHDAEGHLVGIASLDDLLPACLAPLAGLAEALRHGLERETAERGPVAAPPRPVLRVPPVGTAGWSLR